MQTKNLAFIIILSALTMSETCSGMSYIRNWYNSFKSKDTATSQNAEAKPKSPNMFQRFMHRCRKVGVLPTISAAFGVYNFKTMSGLDYNSLDTYSSDKLKDAQDLLAERIKDLGHSQKLEDFFMLVQNKKMAAINREDNIAMQKTWKED